MRANHCVIISFVLGSTLIGGSAEARQGRGSAPSAPSGTVTLTVADYDRLLDRAAQPSAAPDQPPVPAIVGVAELRARVDDGSVRGTLRLEGEIFQRGPVKVPLVSGATLLDAKAGARPLPLVQDGGTHSAVFTGPAPFSAVLEWAGVVRAEPGRSSVTLPQPASASVSVIVDLPGDPADIRLASGILTRRQSTAGRTIVEIAPNREQPVRVSWSAREAALPAAAVQPLFLGDLRSLLTIGEADLRLTTMVDVTVVRGEPRTFQMEIPEHYDVADVSGSSVERSETQNRTVTITVREPSRRHQFLIRLERPNDAGSFALATSFPSLRGAQRQAGEAAIEGMGTMEVSAAGDAGLRRMDVREANAGLRSLARQPLLAAFRYQRREEAPPVLKLDVKRFADAPVIAAAIEHAVATTLVTPEGRMLTEVALLVRNRAQPFMKVTLPDGATILSVEVAGEPARPVEGGGMRIPLLRPGFRPEGAYAVSFVYHHAGAPFAKRGDAQMSLAGVEVPINLLEWELFLPEQFSAKPVAGNVIPARLVQPSMQPQRKSDATVVFGDNLNPGLLTGRVVDALGGVIPGASVSLAIDGRTIQRAVTDANGTYTLRGVQSGTITVTCEIQGFMSVSERVAFTGAPPRIDFRMEVAALVETVTVMAESVVVGSAHGDGRGGALNQTPRGERDGGVQQAPPQNIVNLQQRVAGVLPVRIDVPRAGNLFRFYRPIVLDEKTEVTLRYRRR